jgi:drug/metabolite transporter (DMT)-like permease
MPDELDAKGAILAMVSGAVTSGIGYAVWYAVLPRFQSTTAAILQLSVPLIAALLGYLFLAEVLTWRLVFAAGLVFLGTIVALRQRRR